MPEILFTKQLDRKKVSEKLGSGFAYDFVDMIHIFHVKSEPFDLKNKSLIFSSVNGVKSFFENGFQPNEDFTADNYNKVYAVGRKTKEELRRNGFGTFKVTRHASELSEFIIQDASREKFLHFCGNLALDILDRKLPLQNIYYKKLPVYRTELLYPEIKKNYDAVAFFSPSGVRSFAKNNSFEGKKIFSIGYTTERELRKHSVDNIITSKESNLDDLLDLIKKEYD